MAREHPGQLHVRRMHAKGTNAVRADAGCVQTSHKIQIWVSGLTSASVPRTDVWCAARPYDHALSSHDCSRQELLNKTSLALHARY